jgi:hypothetical protein
VTQGAADKIAAVEGGLAEWQSSIQRRHELLASKVDAAEAKLNETMGTLRDQLSTILARLDKPPEPLTSPPNSEGNPGEPKTPGPAEEPPKPPERRRAHRWI